MTVTSIRGADVLAQTLERCKVKRIFSLSGNQIMPVYDALFDTAIQIIHARHEAASVHMAHAYSRVTGQVGFALVTGGQGHTNAVSALATTLASEVPVVLLSGQAAIGECGRGAFQEMRQADFARQLTKASWVVKSAANMGHDLVRAMQIACSGRPGPVHLSLPIDLLNQKIDGDNDLWPARGAEAAVPMPLAARAADLVLAEIRAAKRPLILSGPALCNERGREQMRQLEQMLCVPVIGMESPRGVNDPGLGAFAQVLAQADLIVLLGKPLDFTLRFGDAPHVATNCFWIVIDPDPDLLARAAKYKKQHVLLSALASPLEAMERMLACDGNSTGGRNPWLDEVKGALSYRPMQWDKLKLGSDGPVHPVHPVHPVQLGDALQTFFDRHPQATLVCDGGEIGQWPQAIVSAKKRMINGVAGAIGVSLPFALGVRAADPDHPVLAVMGDGSFGFHMAEFDTAVRHGLPVIVVIGNDARWNAEYQIQLRDYGESRARGCELLPVHYEKVAEALGGYGEFVSRASDLGPALERAFQSGKPACINVALESVASPVVRRDQ